MSRLTGTFKLESGPRAKPPVMGPRIKRLLSSARVPTPKPESERTAADVAALERAEAKRAMRRQKRLGVKG